MIRVPMTISNLVMAAMLWICQSSSYLYNSEHLKYTKCSVILLKSYFLKICLHLEENFFH